MYSKNVESKIEKGLLASHITNNSDFEKACQSGDGARIIAIVQSEMEKNKLFTKGSKKLYEDILAMLQGREKVSESLGNEILSFVWYSRMSGIGYAVI